MHNTFDKALDGVGQFGKYQFIVQIIVSFVKFFQEMQVLVAYFLTLEPQWKCKSQFSRSCMNGTYLFQNKSHDDVNMSVTFPFEDKRRCSMPRELWEYTEAQDYSVVTYFDLSCDENWKIYLVMSISFAGWAIGSMVFGWLADNYGRKKVLVSCYVTMLGSSLIGVFSPNIESLIISRFFVGFYMAGVLLAVLAYSSELVGNKYRPATSIELMIVSSCAQCILPALALLFNNWRILLTACSAINFVIIITFKWVPESPRWLYKTGRVDKANKILEKIAKVNGRNVAARLTTEESQNKVKASHSKVKTLLIDSSAVFQTLSQAYGWFAITLTLFGMSFASGDLGGSSMYLNFFFTSLIEIPGSLIAILICKRLGRKIAVIYPLFFGGTIITIVAILPSSGISKLGLGLFGKFLVSMSFDAMFTWSAELFPTSIRAFGLGVLQVSSRIGGGVSPWICKGVATMDTKAPFLIMGALTLSSSLLLCWLPETKTRNLDDFE